MRALIGLGIAAILASTGCGEDVGAHINCKVADAETVACTIEQTKGTVAVEVCWEFKVTCANGATLETARTCGQVKDGKTANVTIPADKVTVTGSCDAVKNAELLNKTIKAAD